MRRLITAAAIVLLAGAAAAQDNAAYTRVGNPYQAEFPFEVGEAVQPRVELGGILMSEILVNPRNDVEAGRSVKCSVIVRGTGASEERATLTLVLLLEAEDSHGLEKVALDPFRIKPGKPFERDETVRIEGDALLGARKVYLFAEVAP